MTCSPRLDEIHRRRTAAERVEPLACCDCGGWHRDPLYCSTRRRTARRLKPTLTGQAGINVDVIATTARILIDRTGFPGLYPIQLVRELWMRGGEDRELAEMIHAAGGARP